VACSNRAFNPAYHFGVAPRLATNHLVVLRFLRLFFGKDTYLVLPPLAILHANVSTKLDYVLFQVIFTLATVETSIPGGIGTENVSLLDDLQAQSKRSEEAKITSAKDHHVSSSLRATLRHLQSEAGDMSMFRGIGAYAVMTPLFGLLAFITHIMFQSPFREAGRFAEIASTVATRLLMAWFEVTWLHIVISKPRQKFWFRRLPLTFFSVLRILWISVVCAALVLELLDWLASALQSLNFFRVGTNTTAGKVAIFDGPLVSDLSLSTITWTLLRVTSLSLLGSICQTLVLVPLETIRNRIGASILPDEDDPIVPTDRSFSNGPSSGLLHQQQPLGFIQACRSIDLATYLRMVKVSLKFELITRTLDFCLWALVLAQLAAVLGSEGTWIALKMIFGTRFVHEEMGNVPPIARKLLYGVMTNATNATGAGNITTVELVKVY